MMDLIDRQAAIDAVEKLHIPEDMCVFEIVSHIELAISTLPSAQPERKTGRWERHYSRPNVYADLWWHCSVCGHTGDFSTNFCPNCGCRMMEVEHD